MAINIVKLENGNVALYDNGTGDFLRSLSADYVELECNVNGNVKLIQNNGNVEFFTPALVANTQILPAAAVPFAGTCADLAELLATDFFFELTGGGGVDIQYDKEERVSFVHNVYAISTLTLLNNVVRWFPYIIEEDIEIIDFAMAVNTLQVGGVVLGLYDMLDGKPNNLLFESLFDTNVSGTQIYTLPSPQVIKKGVYYLAYSTNTTAILRGVSGTSLRMILQILTVPQNGASCLSKAYTYTGTLPASYAAVGGTVSTNFSNVPHVIFKIS